MRKYIFLSASLFSLSFFGQTNNLNNSISNSQAALERSREFTTTSLQHANMSNKGSKIDQYKSNIIILDDFIRIDSKKIDELNNDILHLQNELTNAVENRKIKITSEISKIEKKIKRKKEIVENYKSMRDRNEKELIKLTTTK